MGSVRSGLVAKLFFEFIGEGRSNGRPYESEVAIYYSDMDHIQTLESVNRPLISVQFGKIPLFGRDFWIKSLVFFSIFLLGIDFIYKSYFGITYQNRADCILYANLPRWAFICYENFVELFLVVITGIYMAALLEKYFTRVGKFIPKNQIMAFIYASLIPVCSCSAIPFARTMNDRVPFRVIITFIIAAPLLNPYIIMLSTMVLGLKYAILRIVCSLILAVSAGYIVELFYKRTNPTNTCLIKTCGNNPGCPGKGHNVYETTYLIFRKVFAFLLIAGILGTTLELISPDKYLLNVNLSNNLTGSIMVILVGIPIYFCNGADVLFLKPLMQFSHLPLGTAMAFSLTSTSICITSLLLLVKYIGRKLTAILLVCIMVLTLLLSILIQFLTG